MCPSLREHQSSVHTGIASFQSTSNRADGAVRQERREDRPAQHQEASGLVQVLPHSKATFAFWGTAGLLEKVGSMQVSVFLALLIVMALGVNGDSGFLAVPWAAA